MPSILIVDDSPTERANLQRSLQHSYEVRTAASKAEAFEQLATPPDAMLLDVRLGKDPNNRDGLLLLEQLRSQLPHLPVVMITGHADLEVAKECIRLQVTDFVEKAPGYIRNVELSLQTAFAHARSLEENRRLRQELSRFKPGKMIGSTATMQQMQQYIQAYANDGDVTVLVRGEPGTGKELVAEALHKNGRRADAPFIDSNLSALSADILESEIFGHEKGAFTGADERKFGFLDQVRGGVLFLDEIGEIKEDLQVKLLRVIQERKFQRMGGAGLSIPFDAQIVLATNANLEQKIRDGLFRQDFYDRINVAQIWVPPLRERKEDIPALVEHFLGILRSRGKNLAGVSDSTMKLFMNYDWPGNVRELENLLEGVTPLVLMRNADTIEPDDVRTRLQAQGMTAPSAVPVSPGPSSSPAIPSVVPVSAPQAPILEEDFSYELYLARQELEIIRQGLAQWGTITNAAPRLGYSARFQLSSRRDKHAEKFPQLKEEFPDLYNG